MTSETFDFTGSVQTFDVPDGVSSIAATVIGASGADGDGTKGLGAEISGNIPVLGNETLYIYVGGEGDNQTGGWPTGGDADTNDSDAGAGGGHSGVRRDEDTLAARKLVAGAGGGGSGGTSSSGGQGGNATEDDGEDGQDGQDGANGGGGGTQTSAGGGGSGGGGSSATNGQDGDGPNGGDGAQVSGNNSHPGGGGGGGYFGGGGGGSHNTAGRAGSGGAGSTWSDTDVSNVSAQTAGSDGDGSVVIEWTSPPTNLQVDDEREDEIDLTWDFDEDEAEIDEYRVYQHTDEDPFDNGSMVGTSSDKSFTASNLTNAAEYFYQVTPVHEMRGESSPSEETSGITLLPATEIGEVEPDDHRELELTWTNADDNSDGTFEIYRSQESGVTGPNIDSVDQSTSDYTDTGLDHGAVYYYTLERDTGERTAQSVQQSGTTTVPEPSNVSVDSTQFDTRVVIEFSDETAEEARHEVQTRRQGSDWETDADLDEGETGPVESRDLAPNRPNTSVVEVRVRAYIDD